MKLKGSQTEKNLREALLSEEEANRKFEKYAKTAKEEGFLHICELFEETASAEMQFETRYKRILENIDFEANPDEPVLRQWVCRKCGTTFNLSSPGNLGVCNNCTH